MAPPRISIAMTAEVDRQLSEHLLRPDEQEDVCLATYSISTGQNRVSYLLRSVILPRPGERLVHGNASFTGDYILRGAQEAAQRDEGLVMLHSHPTARTWQLMSNPDFQTESRYAGVATATTEKPMVGMTLAGRSGKWSGRVWRSRGQQQAVESVRVVGEQLALSWNDALRPVPTPTSAQVRTVSAWGATVQADFARVRVLVVGTGSVGLDVAQRLVASGVSAGVMDFDEVQPRNLDRMIGARRSDARRRRPKVVVAGRLMRAQATAATIEVVEHELSICDPRGLAAALDYDVIFSCVDRPWARAVLNEIAYADLIPVIDGGINIELYEDGRMRSATARAHTVLPGRPCLVCSQQIRPDRIQLDKQGLLDDEDYIRRSGLAAHTAGQNVATMSATVSAMLLTQFVSLIATPGGVGVPDPLCFHFTTHTLEHLEYVSNPTCRWESHPGEGDHRVPMAGEHLLATLMMQRRRSRRELSHLKPAAWANQLAARIARWVSTAQVLDWVRNRDRDEVALD